MFIPAKKAEQHRKHLPGPLTLLPVESKPKGWWRVHRSQGGWGGHQGQGSVSDTGWEFRLSAPHPMTLQDPRWLSQLSPDFRASRPQARAFAQHCTTGDNCVISLPLNPPFGVQEGGCALR